MKTTETTTVGEIAAANPGTVRIFQKYDIDFCCGGKRPVTEVCRERGIAEEHLLRELEEATAPRVEHSRDWNSASLAELTRHIVATHHEYLKLELPRLAKMAAKVYDAHGHKYPYLAQLEETFLDLKEELDAHLTKEEMVLFPLIEGMEAAGHSGESLPPTHCGSVSNPIRVMELEHDNAGRALERMRQLTSGYELPSDACNTFRAFYHGLQEMEADLHQHIHLENNILHPRASRLEATFA